jgi:chloride channel protein, CIC family
MAASETIDEEKIVSSTENDEDEGHRRYNLLWFSLIAIIVGVVTGFGAVVFRALIAFIHNLSFHGTLSAFYDANVHTLASPWGAFIILVPVIGGLGVTFLVTKFAPEARGHGVPEVMDAIYYGGGTIRPVVAVVKSLASALSIGTGAAVGREGPIIQIGASFASSFGGLLRMPPWQRITLVAAGAGGGIAATFNTPIGGVMFAIELLMPEVSVRTFLPVALATGTATYIGQLFFGFQPAFRLPPAPLLDGHATSIVSLLLYAVIGVITGAAAAAFVRSLHGLEELYDHIKNSYLRHVIGMLIVGALIYGLMVGFGHYYVEGVGYATIEDILSGTLTAGYLMALLFVCKLFATTTSLGSGASGGIFSPSLFMGATLGGAFGALANMIHPSPDISIPGFAMVGMAAMVAGGTGAVMTSVTMIFEMTRDYNIVMPMIIAVAVAVGVRRVLSRENIYTIKLVGRGHVIPKALHANMFLVRHAKDVMDKNFLVLPDTMDFETFLREHSTGASLKHIVVTHEGRIAGVLRVNTVFRRGIEGAFKTVTLGDIAERKYTLAREDDIIFDVIPRMWRKGSTMVIVAKSKGARPLATDVLGVITKEHVADSVAASVKPYAA